ncbi:hypothetical protein [Okeania sp. SIO2B3]|uniref:hypothetical protein n=1 Tax=Okeania sp. SIO2B3 TaxID=2607784 RepID=UPI0013C00775|nr:hypothetical protein [Okeania sp. SIO2B3]NET41920.1 hypothetical protein [Okeania sp. SIO2B3]
MKNFRYCRTVRGCIIINLTLPISEQISLSASRVLKLKTHLKLHKEKLKKSRTKLGTGEEVDDQLYRFLERERVLESKLADLLRNIIPITQPNKNILLKSERERAEYYRPFKCFVAQVYAGLFTTLLRRSIQ